MPIFGITASSNQTVKLTDFYQISTTTLSSAQSSIVFSNIPQTYTHLQIRYIARNSGANTDLNVAARFNSDSSSNYSEHYLYGTGSAAASGGAANTTAILFGRITGASSTASIFGACVADILDYRDTNKFKTSRLITGNEQNGSGFVFYESGNWRSTNAITSITIYPVDSHNFVSGSSFQLYGVNA